MADSFFPAQATGGADFLKGVETQALGNNAATQITTPTKNTKLLTATANLILSATPTIAAGVEGQEVTIRNASAANTIEFQDETDLAGTKMHVEVGEKILGPGDTIRFQCRADGSWGAVSRRANVPG